MRHLLLFVLFNLVSVFAFSQAIELKYDNKHAIFEKEIHASGSAQELYNKAIGWFESNFSNANQVLTSKKDGQEIIAHASISKGMKVNSTTVGNLFYQMKLTFSDGVCYVWVDHMKFNNSFPVERYVFSSSGVEKSDDTANTVKESTTDSMSKLLFNLSKAF